MFTHKEEASEVKPPGNALEKMQQIANRLISNTPELAKILDNDSALKPKHSFSPKNKKHMVSNMNHINLNKGDLTANDYHQRCKELQYELGLTQDKKKELEIEIDVIKNRFVEREIQYRKIIQELQDEIKSKNNLGIGDKNRLTTINELHQEILNNIGVIQHKTSKILVEQQSDIRRFFHKKINEIKEKFKQDKLNKNEKDNEYQQKEKQMMSELEWIKNIAQKIDVENQTITKKFNTLKSEFDLQNKDKDLLLKELLVKKKQNAILKAQVGQYEKLLGEVSKQIEEEEKSRMESQMLDLPNQSSIYEVKSKKQEKFPQISARNRPNHQTNLSTLSKTSERDPCKKKQNTLKHLNSIIQKEKKRNRELKALYLQQISSKSQLQKVIRQLVDDIREEIVQEERARTYSKKKSLDEDKSLSRKQRDQLLHRLLENQKILSLVYDKTFFNTGQPKAQGKGITNFVKNQLPFELQEQWEEQMDYAE